MGLLDGPDGPIVLRARHRMGRAPDNHTLVPSPDVSGEHALLTWDDLGWQLRDLGSRNGCTVRGVPLPSGARARLAVGDPFSLGPARFTLRSDAPPSAAGRSGDRIVEGEFDVLGLPDLDDPQAFYRYEPVLGWLDGNDQPVDDGTTVTVDDAEWTLVLPPLDLLEPTRSAFDERRSLLAAGLVFAVSPDEEHVEITVQLPDASHTLAPRKHHHVLLALARARLADRADGIAEAAAGWLHTEDLQDQLRITRNQVYLAAHRTKKELEALEVTDASQVVERRKPAQQLRLGVERIEVRRA